MTLTKAPIISAFCVLIACGLVMASYSGGDYGYEFPRITSLIILGLSLVLLVQALRSAGSSPFSDISIPWSTLFPALAILMIFIMIMDKLGFYMSSLLTFIALSSLYSPNTTTIRSFSLNVAISAIFMSILYGVFTALLKVQFPKGILF